MNPNPFSTTYTLTALNASGHAAALTGAGPFATFGAGPADKLGHEVTLASTANLSGINLTISGLDANGNALSAVIAGPNNNTVTSTAHFASVTGIAASSTLGANTMNVGWNNDIVTPWYNFNYSVAAFLAAVAVVLKSGTATFNIEHAYDLPTEAATAFIDVAGAVANQEFAYNSITRATRVHVTAQAAAVLGYSIIQGAH